MRRLIRHAPVVYRLALVVACTAVLCAPASAAPTLPLGHAGRWITDARGRVVIVHGTNMVYKPAPYYPSVAGFGDDDAAFLARIGFNAVRVGVIWKGVEPRPGVYDSAYLGHIAKTVATLARHHVLSLLDFHQDMYNERFQGEGAPDWAVQDGGLPNPKLGFPGNYTGNPALQHALDAFFNNATGPHHLGLQRWFAGAWSDVATRFRHVRSVLGYELFNEPFPGSQWMTCANTMGCPFDAKLTALYRRVDRAIRGVDGHTLVWYEPNVLFNNGAGTKVGALRDRHGGFAFHDYCLQEPQTHSPSGCDQFDDMVFSDARAHVARTGEALIETEWGSTTDTAYLSDMRRRADRDMVPWLEWSYCACHSPTDTGQPGIVEDPHKPPRGSNRLRGTLRALVEPYPQVIAGTPLSWSFNNSSRTFRLRYSTHRAGGRGSFRAGSIAEIVLPALVYNGHYKVRVSGGKVVSALRASLLRIASTGEASRITVTVTPAPTRRVVPAGRSAPPRAAAAGRS
jgi:endoglycosylceramidase